MLSDRFRARNENSRKVFLVTFLPPTIWLILFLLAPVLIIVVYSFSQKVGLINIEVNWVMDNYRRAADPLYLKNFFKEFLYCWNYNIFVPHYLFSCRISHYKSPTKLEVNYSSSSNASVLDKSAHKDLCANCSFKNARIFEFWFRMDSSSFRIAI